MLEVNHSRVSTVILVAVVLVARALALVGAKPAEAAFPGTNGKKIVFSNNRIATTSPTGDYEIFTMTAGGANQTSVSNNAAPTVDLEPEWQPVP
jgi:hypothetical protein